MGAAAPIFWELKRGTGTHQDPQIAISSRKKVKKKWQEKNEKNSLLICEPKLSCVGAHSHYSLHNALDFQTVPHNILP